MLKRFPKPTHLPSLKWRGFFLFLLITMVMLSIVAIVAVQHQIRHTETEYYLALKQQLQAKEEWGRLMLEQTYLSAPSRVQVQAEEALGMTMQKTEKQNLYTIYIEASQED